MNIHVFGNSFFCVHIYVFYKYMYKNKCSHTHTHTHTLHMRFITYTYKHNMHVRNSENFEVLRTSENAYVCTVPMDICIRHPTEPLARTKLFASESAWKKTAPSSFPVHRRLDFIWTFFLNGKSARLSFLPGQLKRKQLYVHVQTCMLWVHVDM